MKKAIIILVLLIPLTCTARFGWSFRDYSFLAGQQYKIDQQALWAIEFQYDLYKTGCIRPRSYFGIGANYAFGNDHNQYGIKIMWNPIRLYFLAGRSTHLYPYFFGQGNLIESKEQNASIIENEPVNSYNFRPGLGLAGRFRTNNSLSIRANLQLGSDITNENQTNFKNSLALEIKIGIGINIRHLIRNQRDTKKENLSNQ